MFRVEVWQQANPKGGEEEKGKAQNKANSLRFLKCERFNGLF